MATLSVGGTTVFDGSALQSGVTGDVSGVTIFPAGHVVQIQSVETGALATGSANGPYLDDTPPQSNEGDQVLSLAITPTSATNKLEILINISVGVDGGTLFGSLFQDSNVSASASCCNYVSTANTMWNMGFAHTMVAATTSATTWKLRIGTQISHTISLNGVRGGRMHGGTCKTSMIIKEYIPWA